jgi:hypothetical protein
MAAKHKLAKKVDYQGYRRPGPHQFVLTRLQNRGP